MTSFAMVSCTNEQTNEAPNTVAKPSDCVICDGIPATTDAPFTGVSPDGNIESPTTGIRSCDLSPHNDVFAVVETALCWLMHSSLLWVLLLASLLMSPLLS